MRRRGFIGAGMSTGAVGGLVWANSDGGYVFAWLGDLHYDRPEHHDMDWVNEHHPRDIRQIETYCEITKQHSPALLASVSASLNSHGMDPFAIIQVGDFVEGVCGSHALQVAQFKDAVKFVEPYAGSNPFLITKGNHDVTGPGAEEAYAEVLLPWLGDQLGIPIRKTSYFVEHRDDLFIFFDGYQPDLAWLKRVLAEKPARHVFFIIHQPVVPYNARSLWHVFAREQQRPQRKELLHLLGECRAIVLCGHLHHYCVLRRKTETGAFVQVAMNSVLSGGPRPVELIHGLDAYGPSLVDLEPQFDPKTRAEREAALLEEKPFVEYFELAKTPGYGVITVSNEAVVIDARLGDDRDSWRRLSVERGTLKIKDEGIAATLGRKGICI